MSDYLKEIERNQEGALSDVEIATLVQKEQCQLFNEIINRYEKKLLAYIISKIGNREDAKDILQNVFIKAYKNINSFDTKRKFSSWIYRISHNEVVNTIRSKTIRQAISIEASQENGDSIELKDDSATPEEEVIQKEIDYKMKEVLETLPENYRKILYLRFYEDLSYKEIAKKEGKGINYIGVLIKRAKKKLIEQINGD